MKAKPVKTAKDLRFAKDRMAPIKQIVSSTSVAGKLRDQGKSLNSKIKKSGG
jgi:hypothetical protein